MKFLIFALSLVGFVGAKTCADYDVSKCASGLLIPSAEEFTCGVPGNGCSKRKCCAPVPKTCASVSYPASRCLSRGKVLVDSPENALCEPNCNRRTCCMDGEVDPPLTCTEDSQCDDSDVTTDDTCVSGSCVYTPTTLNCLNDFTEVELCHYGTNDIDCSGSECDSATCCVEENLCMVNTLEFICGVNGASCIDYPTVSSFHVDFGLGDFDCFCADGSTVNNGPCPDVVNPECVDDGDCNDANPLTADSCVDDSCVNNCNVDNAVISDGQCVCDFENGYVLVGSSCIEFQF